MSILGQKEKIRGLKLNDIPAFETLVGAIGRALKDVDKGRYKIRDLAIISTLVFCGCRIGEVSRLRWDDINFRRKTIRVKQLKKRAEHHRIIPIPSILYWKIIERYHRWFLKNNPQESEVFPLTDRQLRNIVYSFTKRYLKRRYRPHSIRHSYAVFMMKKIRDLEAIRRLLGHSTYKWLKEYLNYTQEDLEEILEEAFKHVEA